MSPQAIIHLAQAIDQHPAETQRKIIARAMRKLAARRKQEKPQ